MRRLERPSYEAPLLVGDVAFIHTYRIKGVARKRTRLEVEAGWNLRYGAVTNYDTMGTTAGNTTLLPPLLRESGLELEISDCRVSRSSNIIFQVHQQREILRNSEV
ncbi:hypothetical protein Tco_0832476 [Tanacetum coccineum]